MIRAQVDPTRFEHDSPATLYDYAGAIHIHSTLSDGTGSVPEIIKDAQDADLDFLILTDHEHLDARDLGFERWHGETLCLVGEEVTPRFHNHYLAFNIDKPVKGRGNWRQPQSFIDEVREQGGLGFIAHPIGEDYPTRAMACPWLNWEVTGNTGIELWSYMHDWARNVSWKNAAKALRHPDRVIRGPHRKALARWDALGKDRRVVALGTLDIHAKRIPALPIAKILPYLTVFRTIRTHVLTREPLNKDNPLRAAEQVYDSLNAGHCFIAHDGFGDGSGFHFTAQRLGHIAALMGDELPYESGLELHANVPDPAHIRLLRDGNVIDETDGKRLSYAITTPGVYRIEARKQFRPWIFSNAIYVRPT